MLCTPNIAIDGPAGSGKSTVAKIVAKRLNLLYVDTGAMYRAITYLALRSSIDLNDEEALARTAEGVKFSLVHNLANGMVTLWCNGEDLTPFLRSKEVSQAVSRVAAVEHVRHQLVRYQRIFAQIGGVVMEGRDIGTVVLPDADFKFYLTADLEVRLQRRQRELISQGQNYMMEELRREMILRDEMDAKREIGPLKIAPDAVVIDCTYMPVEEVVEKILNVCGEVQPNVL